MHAIVVMAAFAALAPPTESAIAAAVTRYLKPFGIELSDCGNAETYCQSALAKTLSDS